VPVAEYTRFILFLSDFSRRLTPGRVRLAHCVVEDVGSRAGRAPTAMQEAAVARRVQSRHRLSEGE